MNIFTNPSTGIGLVNQEGVGKRTVINEGNITLRNSDDSSGSSGTLTVMTEDAVFLNKGTVTIEGRAYMVADQGGTVVNSDAFRLFCHLFRVHLFPFHYNEQQDRKEVRFRLDT